MPQHSPYASSNQRLSLALNGHSPNLNGTPRSSGPDGQPRPGEIDSLTLHLFGIVPGATSGLLEDLDFAGLGNNVPKAMPPPDDRSRFAGRPVNDRLLQFYWDRDGPWNQEKFRVKEHPQALPSSFTGFRETVATSECETSVGQGALQSDSGYGSQAKQSVGIPSVYGDVDRTPESLLNQLADFQIPHGSTRSSFQAHDVNHFGHPWPPGTLGRPDAVPSHSVPNYICHYCQHTSKSRSENTKHIARHEKPHRCPEPDCPKGFSTANDLERHRQSVHNKDGIRYRCHHGVCQPKAKDWPRADNFRSHLKKMHGIHIDAEDSLEDYIYRPVNPEILSNVGVAPELIPPPVHGSSDSPTRPWPSWSPLEQESRTAEASGELRSNRHEHLPPPVRSHYGGILEPQLANERNLTRNASVVVGVYPSQQAQHESQQASYHGVPSGGNPRFVRPSDLKSGSPDITNPASPATQLEEDGIVLDNSEEDSDDDGDDGGDDDVGAHEGINNQDALVQVNARRSPSSPPKPLQDRHELSRSLIEEIVEHNKGSAKIDIHPDPASGAEEAVRLSTPVASVPASIGPSEDPDDIDSEGTEAALQKLMVRLDKEKLEKVLRTLGYVKPEESQPKPRKSTDASSDLIPCPEPGCNKGFRRRCELTKHGKRHEKPYGCTQCQRRFGSKNDWKRHENSQHFQHEIWKCDEPLKAPLTDVCNKVCHRRETFKQHLAAHHGIRDAQKQEAKLEKCRIGQLGEARFWCGFCRDVIELDTENLAAQDACNARYNHIDDHYYGRKGLVKRKASDWHFGDSEAAEGKDVKTVARGGKRNKGEDDDSTPVEGLRKRKRDGYARATKRAKTSPLGESIMWYCCQCNSPWNVSNVPSCLTCPSHVRCDNCPWEEVKGKDG